MPIRSYILSLVGVIAVLALLYWSLGADTSGVTGDVQGEFARDSKGWSSTEGISFRGLLYASTDGKTWNIVNDRSQIRESTFLKTRNFGNASIEFSDGSGLVLGRSSQVQLLSLTGDASKLRVQLHAGELDCTMIPRETHRDIVLSTEIADVHVTGTVLRASATSAELQVSVAEGKLHVNSRSDGQRHDLTQGQSLLLSRKPGSVSYQPIDASIQKQLLIRAFERNRQQSTPVVQGSAAEADLRSMQETLEHCIRTLRTGTREEIEALVKPGSNAERVLISGWTLVSSMQGREAQEIPALSNLQMERFGEAVKLNGKMSQASGSDRRHREIEFSTLWTRNTNSTGPAWLLVNATLVR